MSIIPISGRTVCTLLMIHPAIIWISAWAIIRNPGAIAWNPAGSLAVSPAGSPAGSLAVNPAVNPAVTVAKTRAATRARIIGAAVNLLAAADQKRGGGDSAPSPLRVKRLNALHTQCLPPPLNFPISCTPFPSIWPFQAAPQPKWHPPTTLSPAETACQKGQTR